MRRNPLEVQIRNRVKIGCRQERLNTVGEIVVIFDRHRFVNAITRCHLFTGLLGSAAFNVVIGILGSGRVQMQDRCCVNDQHPGAILLESQMHAIRSWVGWR